MPLINVIIGVLSINGRHQSVNHATCICS